MRVVSSRISETSLASMTGVKSAAVEAVDCGAVAGVALQGEELDRLRA
jgi:hypothetical protein